MSWLADFKKEHLDYVILGNHYDYTDEGNLANYKPLADTGGFYFGRCERPDEIRRYGKRTVAGMQTGIFDLMGIQHSENKNGHGIGYPYRSFWEIASLFHIQAIIGLDAHLVSHIDRTDLYDQAHRFMMELGIPTISCLEEKQ
jgi:hypothetical protein